MATLIEDLYQYNELDIKQICSIKMNELSNFDKNILGLKGVHGYQENNIFDICFMNKIPLQFIYSRYKFLLSIKNTV